MMFSILILLVNRGLCITFDIFEIQEVIALALHKCILIPKITHSVL